MSLPADDDFDFGNLDAMELDIEEEALVSGTGAGSNITQANFFSGKLQSNANGGNRNVQTKSTNAPQQLSKNSNEQYDEFDELGDIGDLLDDNDLFEDSTPTAPPPPPPPPSTFFNRVTPQHRPLPPQIQQRHNPFAPVSTITQQAQPKKFFPIFSGANQPTNSTNNTTLQKTTSGPLQDNRVHQGGLQRQGSSANLAPIFLKNNSSTTTPQPIQNPNPYQNPYQQPSNQSSLIIPRSEPTNDFATDIFRSPEVPTQPSQSPTHHEMDERAILTWQYPINYPKRDYQFNIIRRSLFCNTLVSLPTGLGKTFIAAVVMLNYFRWFPKSKIIFMAPTRPLVNQQIEACYHVCGIPQDVTVEMTGNMNSDFRRDMWMKKRVIYCTPQVLQNDINSGICPAEDIVCLVVDEAHRAVGRYSYSEVVRLLEPINRDVRIMALTATPGGDIKTVQKVISNLKIAKIEMRTEDSMDLRDYVFKRTIQEIVVPCGKEIAEIRDKFQRLMRPFLDRLAKNNVIRTTDPAQLTRFSLIQGREAYMMENQQHSATKSFILKQVAICMGLIHAYELLTIHGIRPFFVNMDPTSVTIENSNRSTPSDTSSFSGAGGARRNIGNKGDKDDDNKQSAAKQAMRELPEFNRMMDSIRIKMRSHEFCSHPKLDRLVGVVVKHFTDHEDQNDAIVQARAAESANDDLDAEPLPQTRVMIFANYRESVEEIGRVLEKFRPIVKVQSFIGQATAKGKKGITQKEQQRVVADFQKGQHNVLVATSIGEEGLDIGDVDLIVCYDSHSSPIRMLQRMGRTGRKRKGKICLLLSEGQEELKYRRAQSSYKTIQRTIAQGQHIQYYPNSPRILPPGNPPTCDLVNIEISEYITPSTSRKRRKVDVGGGMGSKLRFQSAFLDPEEMARFQQRYRIPKRDVKIITFNDACAKALENKRRSVVSPDKTFAIGHSARTMSFINTANKISRLRVEQSLRAISGDNRQKDSYSERMLELIGKWGHSGVGNEDLEPAASTKSRKNGLPSGGHKIRHRLFSHAELSEDDMDELHNLVGNPKKIDPTPIRRRMILDEDEEDDEDGNSGEDKDSRNVGSTSSVSIKGGQPKPWKKANTKTPITDKPRLLSSYSLLAKTTDLPSSSLKSDWSKLPTISDDEVDMEIMGGFGEGFEETVDSNGNFDSHLPELTGSKLTYSTNPKIGASRDRLYLDQDSSEGHRGFDFKEPVTFPLWYKEDKRASEENVVYSRSSFDTHKSLSFIKLPDVPTPGKWYDPYESPSRLSTVIRQLREVEMEATTSRNPKSQDGILFIESSEEESEENKLVKRKKIFASQSASLARARSYFPASIPPLENATMGFNSPGSHTSSTHKSKIAGMNFWKTMKKNATRPEREKRGNNDFSDHVGNSHNSPSIAGNSNKMNNNSSDSDLDDFELGELDLDDGDSFLLEEENIPW